MKEIADKYADFVFSASMDYTLLNSQEYPRAEAYIKRMLAICFASGHFICDKAYSEGSGDVLFSEIVAGARALLEGDGETGNHFSTKPGDPVPQNTH